VRTRRAVSFLILLVAGSACVGASPVPPAPSAASGAGFLVFRDTSFGFRVGYPPDWATQAGTEGTVVTFLAPGPTAGARASVSVLAEPLSDPSQTLDRFADVWLTEQARSIPGYRLVSSDPAVLADRTARRVVYTGQQGTIDLQWEAALTVDRGRAFVLVFIAAPDQFPTLHATAEAIIGSFAID
jgi:hypothetical protein